MLKSTLIEILRTFSKQELIKFEDFVRSPYFNKKENVLQLFLGLKKHAPSFESDDLEKEIVWNALFPGKEYNYGIMKNLIHELTKLSETFILLEQYFKESFRNEYDLIEAASFRNITKLTISKIDKFEKLIKKEIEPNNYSIVDDYLYIVGNFNYARSTFIHQNNLKDSREDALRTASDHALFYFIVQAVKLIHNSIAHQTQGDATIDNTLLGKFFSKLEEHSILEEILLKDIKDHDSVTKIVICFYYLYRALHSNGDKKHYDRFKSYLKENAGIFSAFELQNLNNCRITCAINLRSSDSNNAKETLDWYKFLMEKDSLAQRSGLITSQTMANVVNHAVSLNEIDFAEQVVNKYAGRLPESSRENTYSYCMATISFGKGDFGKSLEYLSMISDEKLMRKYFLKKLYLKIYYELNDYESFCYAFDSYLHFRKRNKLENQARELKFRNFGSYIRSLFRLRNRYDRFEAERLRNEVTKDTINDRNWFLMKLDEISK